MLYKLSKTVAGQHRQLQARKNLNDIDKCPRLNIFRSLRHIYVQIVNTKTDAVLAEVSTLDKELWDKVVNGGMIHAAKVAGEAIAKQALKRGITKVAFDRAGHAYHGRVAALTAAAREAGLKFK